MRNTKDTQVSRPWKTSSIYIVSSVIEIKIEKKLWILQLSWILEFQTLCLPIIFITRTERWQIQHLILQCPSSGTVFWKTLFTNFLMNFWLILYSIENFKGCPKHCLNLTSLFVFVEK